MSNSTPLVLALAAAFSFSAACSSKAKPVAMKSASGEEVPSAPPAAEQDIQSRLAIGDKAPTGEMFDLSGESVSIQDSWQGHASVVVFYRGHW